jgi:hypothetical protein
MLHNRVVCVVAALSGAAAIVWIAGTAARLEVLGGTGRYAVGRTRLAWIDSERPERFEPERKREIIAEVWYPAKTGTGTAGIYVPELTAISARAIESGKLSGLEAWGLGQVRCCERADAEFAGIASRCPVVIFSPGNSTNVEFYAAYGEDLASHGFVVFGINHPYDVTGVRLQDATVAVYAEAPGGFQGAADRVDERAADVRHLIDRLADLDSAGGLFHARLDLAHVGVMGHSRGGHTAARACAADGRLLAGINIDGLHAGNPYLSGRDGPLPTQPFLYIGKQRTIGPQTEQVVNANPRGSLVSIPDARHMDFADVGSFEPALNPFDRAPQRALATACRTAREFFEKHLR